MDSAWLILLSVGLGLIAGVGFTVLIYSAAKRGRHAAEVAHAQVPEGIDAVVDALQTAALIMDASNNVVKVSSRALSMGLVWDEHLVHNELIEVVDRVRHSGETETVDVTVPRGSFGDAAMHLHLRVARLGIRYILLIADDRTNAIHLDEVRRDFIANISHELKTPIGAIALLTEAITKALHEPEQVERFAQRLTIESQRLTRITQEIIALSRLQAEDTLTNPTIVEIDTVLAAAIDQTRTLADSQKVALIAGETTGLTVYGDESLLTVAVHNLITNAILYSSEGSRVGIGVNLVEGVVEIAVTDQGVGISEEDLNRVFERFFRVDPARSRNTGGTGLGLSIVKHTVRNHGGDIRVWSQPGHGSTFTIRVPDASHAPNAPHASVEQ